ncbi:MAG: DUF2207 domain-containing protein [Clostridia bacterium]|nr:DUF2207 domain-containing protein [Clostridia bacterium]
MKYIKFFFRSLIKFLKTVISRCLGYLFVLFFFIFSFWAEGYTWEDFGLDGFSLNPNDYCNLTDVEYTAILRDNIDGKANVEITEYLTFDVHAASRNNTFKEIWRELPEEYVDGLRVTYDVKSVTQILDDGTEVPYKETSKMYWEDEDFTTSSTYRWHHSKGSGSYPDNDESLLIYIPWTYREKMTFKIVYSMNNAALKYNDCSELYLSLYSGNTITKLKSYKAQILIPNSIMPSTYKAYTFGTSNSRLPYFESKILNTGYHTFLIDLDKSDLKFNYHNRYLEFCLLAYGKDKHIFTKYAPNNWYTEDNVLEECIAENEYYESQNRKYNTYKSLLLISSIIISALIINNTISKYRKTKEKYNLCEPEFDYEYFRDIPSDLDPIFASELVFMKDPLDENKEKQEEYAAILLSLVRKKYVTITKTGANKEWDKLNTLISLEPISIDISQNTINDNTGAVLEPLTTSERLYLELLERHAKAYNNSITIHTLQNHINNDYQYTNAFVKDIEKKPALENGVMQGYFQDVNYDAPKKELNKKAKTSLTWGIILLILVNVVSYFTPMALSFGAYTILGVICIWKYIYLTSKASNSVLFTQYGANEQAKWYGLYNFLNSDTLINEKEVHDLPLWEKYLIYATAFGISEKVIKAIKVHAVELNIDNSPILNHHCYIHSSNFHTTSRAFGHSIHTSSRGGFSGHGYGGGGRGGGGGGGGH